MLEFIKNALAVVGAAIAAICIIGLQIMMMALPFVIAIWVLRAMGVL